MDGKGEDDEIEDDCGSEGENEAELEGTEIEADEADDKNV